MSSTAVHLFLPGGEDRGEVAAMEEIGTQLLIEAASGGEGGAERRRVVGHAVPDRSEVLDALVASSRVAYVERIRRSGDVGEAGAVT